MNDNAIKTKPPIWFWVVAALGLVWNVMGVAAFIMQMTQDLAALPEPQRIFYETTPMWATVAFAIAVFGGVLGCLALLLRKSWALTMLLVCLAGIIVQITHSLVVSNGIEVFGEEGIALPVATFSIALLLIWFASYSKKRGWLT